MELAQRRVLSHWAYYITRFAFILKQFILFFFPASKQTEQELLCLTNTSPVDLLCAPVPSCLPSPQLRPDPVAPKSADLIQFEEHLLSLSGKSESFPRSGCLLTCVPVGIQPNYCLG